jgi:hypothetical protein
LLVFAYVIDGDCDDNSDPSTTLDQAIDQEQVESLSAENKTIETNLTNTDYHPPTEWRFFQANNFILDESIKLEINDGSEDSEGLSVFLEYFCNNFFEYNLINKSIFR